MTTATTLRDLNDQNDMSTMSDEFRELGHRVVDLLADYFRSVDGKALFPTIAPSEVNALFDEPVPEAGLPPARVLAEVVEKVLPHVVHVGHPGYMGLITPSPLPIGAIADFIASALNQNVGVYTIGPSAVAVERRTVRWLCDIAGYGPASGGNLTSGGMLANFLGLKLGRDAATGDRAQHDGVRDRFAVYVSDQRHVSIDKSVDCVGLGREALRTLPTDDAFRVRIDALEEAIRRDCAQGIRPLCIVALAGTTNTGAIDDIAALRRIADREGAWLHADAAYGAGMLLSRATPGLLRDLPLADSITMDPHKWFYAPLDAGAILVRDESQLTRSFGIKPPYLTDELDAGERYQYYVHGFEQSRRFRSLKVWMSLKRYGTARIAEWIDANVAQAARLHALAEAHPRLRSAVDPPMSAACIRYESPSLRDEDEVGRLHKAVVRRIESEGRFWFSTTVLRGLWWFRINPVNFRTRLEHMDELVKTLVSTCAELETDPIVRQRC